MAPPGEGTLAGNLFNYIGRGLLAPVVTHLGSRQGEPVENLTAVAGEELMSFTVPAHTFRNIGQQMIIMSGWSHANNANNAACRVNFGGVTAGFLGLASTIARDSCMTIFWLTLVSPTEWNMRGWRWTDGIGLQGVAQADDFGFLPTFARDPAVDFTVALEVGLAVAGGDLLATYHYGWITP